MLNGVGGRTVWEAKLRIPYAEYLQWVAYREKRGTLNVGMSLEYGFALLVSKLLQVNGNKNAKMTDFMPHRDKPGLNLADMSVQDAFTVLTRAARHSKEATKNGRRPRKASDEYLSGKE